MQGSTHSGSFADSEFAITLSRLRMAVWAILLREYRAAYGDRRLGFLWAFIGPLASVAAISIAYVFLAGRHSPLGGGISAFIALGFLNYLLFTSIEGAIENGLKANRGLLAFPRVKPFDIYVGRFLLKASTLIVVGAFMMAAFVAVGTVAPPVDPIRLVPPIVIVCMLAFGIGLINSAVVTLNQAWSTIWSSFRRLLMLTSGVFFVADSMPPLAQKFLYWNPLLHTCEMIRSAWYFYESEFMDPRYPIWVAVGAVFIGLATERALRKRVLGEL